MPKSQEKFYNTLDMRLIWLYECVLHKVAYMKQTKVNLYIVGIFNALHC